MTGHGRGIRRLGVFFGVDERSGTRGQELSVESRDLNSMRSSRVRGGGGQVGRQCRLGLARLGVSMMVLLDMAVCVLCFCLLFDPKSEHNIVALCTDLRSKLTSCHALFDALSQRGGSQSETMTNDRSQSILGCSCSTIVSAQTIHRLGNSVLDRDP